MDLTAQKYFRHCYTLPKVFPALPLPDENFLKHRQKVSGADIISFFNVEMPAERQVA